MSTAELKIDLITRIANTNDLGIIEELHKLLDFELDNKVYMLTPEQEQHIREAKNEYQTGNVLPMEEADKIIEQWLNGK